MSALYPVLHIVVSLWPALLLSSPSPPPVLRRPVIIITIYLSTTRVVGHHRRFPNQFPPFSSVLHCLLELGKLQAVHSLMLSLHLFRCLPFLLPLSLCLAGRFWPVLMNGKHNHTTAVCVSLKWSGSLRMVQLLAGSWHGLRRW